jgi:hypothetical protein
MWWIYGGAVPKRSCVVVIFSKRTEHSLVAETRNISFLGFIGQADFIVFRYSAINKCVPSNRHFRFQDNIIKVNPIWKSVSVMSFPPTFIISIIWECKFYIFWHSWCSFSPLPPVSAGMLRSTQLSTCRIDRIEAGILCIFSDGLTDLSGPLLMSEVRVLGSLNWYTLLWEHVQSVWDLFFSPFSEYLHVTILENY